MKYWRVKYTDDLPDWVGGQAKWFFISIRPKYRNDVGVLEHEKFHVRQWWGGLALALLVALAAFFCGLAVVSGAALGCAIGVHPLAYRLIRPYRRWSEAKAYRLQIAVGRYASVDFAVQALVTKYNLGLTHDEARRLLRLL